MKNLLLTCAAAVVITVAPAFVQTADAKVTEKPYPMEYWAAPNFMSNVEISPSGKYVAFIKATSQMGDNIIEVYKTSDMKAKPKRVGAKRMDLRGFSWVGDEEMVVSFDRQVSKRIKGFNRGARRGKTALYSMETGKFEEISGDDFNLSLTEPLVDKPNKVLVRFVEFKEGQSFRAPSFYEYDLKSGSRKLVLKGNDELFGYRFDKEGNPRFASRFDGGSEEFIYLYRPVGGDGWTEYARQSRDSFERFSYAGLVEGNDDQIYVIAHNGHDLAGLWKYNLSTKSFGELVFRHDEVELRGTMRHTNEWSNRGEVTGVSWFEDKTYRKFFDPSEEAALEQLSAAIPNAHNVTISSRSRDGNALVVFNSGPKDPGTYYLYNNGQFSRLGSINGLLKADDLAELEYIKYQSRDGKTIPAFVHRPKGDGPHPLIVMPHGGPFVTERVSFDDWAQMFANNGYMVLQPQYRGSTNFGLDFYKSAFIDGGKGGYQMQDDKDDGVKHLVAKGEVDPDRVAMFGWSYGGYAALIAAAREPNIYQCVIAGAAVADNNQQVNYYRADIRGSQRVEQLRFWDDSISPIEEAEKVNVPMLVIHGSIDQRVPPSHSRKYVDELEKHNKNFEYIELEDADHFSNTLFYDHKMKAYPAMMEYLEKDCGPGGL